MTVNSMLEGEMRAASVSAAASELARAGDPAGSSFEEAARRVEQEIDRITDQGVAALRGLRDGLDDQIRALLASREALKASVRQQAAFAGQMMQIEAIALPSVADLTVAIEVAAGVASPKTITARRRNGGG